MLHNLSESQSERFHIISQKSWPFFFANHCVSGSIHILTRYNTNKLSANTEKEILAKEVATHFNRDFGPDEINSDSWIEEFLASERYEPDLFLETLYWGLFWADFLMQTYEKNAYMPTRDDCIRTLDLILDKALGYGDKINRINETLVQRGVSYHRARLEGISKFTENLLGLTSNPFQYAVRANYYFSHALKNTLLCSFIDIATSEQETKIHCRKCEQLMTPEVREIPTAITCKACGKEYNIVGFWGASRKMGNHHILYKVPTFKDK